MKKTDFVIKRRPQNRQRSPSVIRVILLAECGGIHNERHKGSSTLLRDGSNRSTRELHGG